MKKIFTFLCVAITAFTNLNAQDRELLTKNWYLKELNLSNSEKYDTKDITIDAKLFFSSIKSFNVGFCSFRSGTVEYNATTSFKFPFIGKAILLDDDDDIECNKNLLKINEKYMNFFGEKGDNFKYTITKSNQGNGFRRILEIRNKNNQKAIYVNSTHEDDKLLENRIEFNIYPNPATDVINVKSTDKITNIKIFALSNSSLVKNVNNATTINISDLQKGSYQIVILSENGFHSQSFIKK